MNELLKVGKCTDLAVVVCDLNGLKQCNDTGGHEAGDQLLRDAADLLIEHFGEYEIYRSGGDEDAGYDRSDEEYKKRKVYQAICKHKEAEKDPQAAGGHS